MLKTNLKLSPRLAATTCPDLDACLMAPDCRCMVADQRAQQARRLAPLAPGVIDGPYLRRSRARQFTLDMLVSLALIAGVIVAVDLVVRLHVAGWF